MAQIPLTRYDHTPDTFTHCLEAKTMTATVTAIPRLGGWSTSSSNLAFLAGNLMNLHIALSPLGRSWGILINYPYRRTSISGTKESTDDLPA
jgi:hypothetical protein